MCVDARIRNLLIVTALAVVGYGACLVAFDAARVRAAFLAVDRGAVLAAFLLAFGNYLVRFARWRFYLGTVGIVGPVLPAFRVFLAGLTMSITPGKFGEVLKSALLFSESGIAVTRTAPAVLAERLTDLVAVVLLAGIGLLISGGFDPQSVMIGAVLALLVIGAVVSDHVFRLVIHLLGRIPSARRWLASLGEARHHLKGFLTPAALAIATFLALVAWTFEGFGFFLLVDAVRPGAMGLLEAIAVYGTATLVGALAMLPGGLGVTEGSFYFFLVRAGLTGESSAIVTLIIRAATLWFAVGIGSVALLISARAGKESLR